MDENRERHQSRQLCSCGARRPKRPGLLYAGTEHGIYLSFDNGENWQSLSLNLPDTQVSDIVLEEHDLVIATHGRAFYVLDNIAPMRQMSAEVTQAAVLHLFRPEGGVRRPWPVAIDYFLKNKADKLTVEILDAKGTVIRSYTGPEDPNKKKDTEDEDEDFRPKPPKVTADAGANRFTWDMRYTG